MTKPEANPTRFPRAGRWAVAAVAGLLLLLQWGLIRTSVRTQSTTSDELCHLTAGYAYWTLADYRLHPENGVLPQRWAALPLLLDPTVRFPATDSDAWRKSDVWTVGRRFLYESGNDIDRLLDNGRAMVALATVALGLVVFLWSRRAFGPLGGLVSLALYAFCPTVLAHGGLVTSDLVASLAFVLTVGAMWRSLRRVTVGRTLLAGVALGMLCVSKMSAALSVPVAVLLVTARLLRGTPLPVLAGPWRARVRGRGRQAAVLVVVLAVQGAVAVGCIWACFGGRYAAFAPGQAGLEFFGGHTVDSLTAEAGFSGRCVRVADRLHLLPEAYLHGFAFVVKHASGRLCFLNGEYSSSGWRTFFPYSFAVKTPLATLGVVLLALLAVRQRARAARVRRAGRGSGGRGALARWWWWRPFWRVLPLLVFLGVYWAFAIGSHLNIGHRHILPTYPVLYVLAGAAAWWLRPPARRLPAGLLAALLLLLAVDTGLTWPHYLAYANRLAGGPAQLYRSLVDSSLDWGQDLRGLRRWIDTARSREPDLPVYVAYFGSGSLAHEGIDAVRLPCSADQGPRDFRPLRGGAYCISATLLQGVYTNAPGPWTPRHEEAYRQAWAQYGPAWTQAAAAATGMPADATPEEASFLALAFIDLEQFRFARLRNALLAREPDAQIGHSILIYRLTDAEAEQALNGPPRPPEP